jgi:hypothetical protein
VDSGTLKVYQYAGAASLTSGSQNASATFALAAGDTNPQGIADPPTADRLMSSAPAPALLGSPSGAALNAAASSGVPNVPALPSPAGPDAVFATSFNAAASGGPSVVASVRSPASRDAVFALLVREALPGEAALDLLASGALTPHLNSPAAVAGRPLTPAGASGGQTPVGPLAPLTSGSSPGFRPDGRAVDLLGGAWSDDDGPASAVVTDDFPASLAEDAPAEEGGNG